MQSNRRVRASATGIVAMAAAILLMSGQVLLAQASTAPGLGSAQFYAILAGTPSVSNSGPSMVSGNIGISPAASVTGFPPGTITDGTIQAATPAAATAKSDLTIAYDAAKASPCNFNKTGTNLGGLTLTPGTYCQTTAPTLTGTLTLSGNGVFIFQAGSTLITAPGASVVLINGAQPCNVFWQVSSSATLDTTTTFVGTILALTDITMNNGVNLTGRALARNGQVSMINDQVTRPAACSTATVAGPVASPSPRVVRRPGLPGAGHPTGPAGSPEFPALIGVAGFLGVAGGVLIVRARRPRRQRP